MVQAPSSDENVKWPDAAAVQALAGVMSGGGGGRGGRGGGGAQEGRLAKALVDPKLAQSASMGFQRCAMREVPPSLPPVVSAFRRNLSRVAVRLLAGVAAVGFAPPRTPQPPPYRDASLSVDARVHPFGGSSPMAAGPVLRLVRLVANHAELP